MRIINELFLDFRPKKEDDKEKKLRKQKYVENERFVRQYKCFFFIILSILEAVLRTLESFQTFEKQTKH